MDYKDYVCRVMFGDGDDAKSWRYGVAAGNEYEVIEIVERRLEDVASVDDIREAMPGERASLRLSGLGDIKLLN